MSLPRSASKPCQHCRVRKVKCDKNEPCSGCVRFSVPCVYEDDGNSRIAGTNTQRHLEARLARVETVLEQQQRQHLQVPPADDLFHDTIGVSRAIAAAASLSAPLRGHVLVDGCTTIYFDSGFWPKLFDESNLKAALLRKGSPTTKDFMFVGNDPPQDPFPSTPEQCNLLNTIFLEKVEPFIGILHEPWYRSELLAFQTGHHVQPWSFNALYNCLTVLTVRRTHRDMVSTVLGVSKAEAVAQCASTARATLSKADVSTTHSLQVLQALLYYITFLYQDGNIEGAIAATSPANSIAHRQGLHEDPTTLDIDALTAEVRCRAWNYLCYLNTLPYMYEGIRPTMGLGNSFYPRTVSDEQWQQWARDGASTIVPASNNAWRQFATLRRQLSALTCHTLQQGHTLTIPAGERLLKLADDQLQKDYYPAFEPREFPYIRRFEALSVRMWYDRLSLTVDVLHLKHARRTGPQFEHEIFTKAVTLLTTVARAEAAAEPLGWSWLFRTDPEFVALAVLLNTLAHNSNLPSEQTNEAWSLVAQFNHRHDNDDFSLKGTAVWRIIDLWRERALGGLQ